jgi:hypothetical protein
MPLVRKLMFCATPKPASTAARVFTSKKDEDSSGALTELWTLPTGNQAVIARNKRSAADTLAQVNDAAFPSLLALDRFARSGLLLRERRSPRVPASA